MKILQTFTRLIRAHSEKGGDYNIINVFVLHMGGFDDGESRWDGSESRKILQKWLNSYAPKKQDLSQGRTFALTVE